MQIMQSMPCKVCFKCGVEKPLADFYKHPQMPDGHVNKCKECNKKDVRENRSSKIDYYREFDKKRNKLPHRVLKAKLYAKTEVGKKNHTESIKRYRANNPNKHKAHSAVNNAVRDGKLKKPSLCEHCGVKGVLHGHHHSYEEIHWLSVEWLCPKCHAKEHNRLKEMGIDPDQ